MKGVSLSYIFNVNSLDDTKKNLTTHKMTENRIFQKCKKIIKFLIVIIKYEHFSKDFGKHIYFQIDQIQ